MVNAVGLAKRALVMLLKEMAALYSLTVGVTRDSPDPAVRTAYRNVSVKTHPDHGGDADHQRQLNAAYSTWETAAKEKQAHGGKGRRGKAAKEKGGDDANAAAPLLPLQGRAEPGFRFQSAAVFLTYQKWKTTDVWARFIKFVTDSLVGWSAKKARVKAFLKTRKAQNAAKRHWSSMRSVARIIIKKKGAASGK